MSISSGLFTRAEFYGKNILKLAPDAFVVVNGMMQAKFISPASTSGIDNLDVRGGITSINISAAVNPPGSSKATIEITAPVYKGLHNDYYVTMPNGTKRSYFTPLMEIKIYMKGFYLVGGNPKYYPVFWGMILNISEDYNDGVYRCTLTCGDILSWWKYQKLTLNPSVTQSAFANVAPRRMATIFQAMSPWQIIWHLFVDTDFADKNNSEAPYNIVYPDWASTTGLLPTFGAAIDGNSETRKKAFRDLAFKAIDYWRARFGFDSKNPQDKTDRIPLEMFGLNGPINTVESVNYLSAFPTISTYQKITESDPSINYNLMSYVQPYGALSLFGEGTEAIEHTKLEVATEVCNQTQMEFFVDTNGSIVFKPPFYNLDVNGGGSEQYVIESSNILNFNATINSEEICTFLEVVSPLYQELPEMNAKGFHIDFDLLKQYGMRHQKISLRYGDNPAVLQLLAVAEMAKTNGRAYQGSVSIPLRPEIRLGYPVYMPHIDAYYYVTGISHSFSFGGSATTNLSLEYRRDRVFDSEGIVGKGSVLKGYVYRRNSPDVLGDLGTGEFNSNTATAEELLLGQNIKNIMSKIYGGEDTGVKLEAKSDLLKVLNYLGMKENELDTLVRQKSSADESQTAKVKIMQDIINDKLKEKQLLKSGIISGPSSNGFFNISKAELTTTTPDKNGKEAAPAGNQLVMITKDTIPYTDKKGYRHIGGFPYGANLSLIKNGTALSNDENKAQQVLSRVEAVVGPDATSSTPKEEERLPVEGAEKKEVDKGTVIDVVTTGGLEKVTISSENFRKDSISKKNNPTTQEYKQAEKDFFDRLDSSFNKSKKSKAKKSKTNPDQIVEAAPR